MRKLLASIIVGTLGFVSLNTLAATTNLLQTISCTLTVYSATGPTITSHGTTTKTVNKSSLNSAGILKDIATDLGTNFSSKAELALVSPVIVESTTTTYTTNHSGKITTNTSVTLGSDSSYPAIVDGKTVIPVVTFLTESSTLTFESSSTNPKGVVTSDIKDSITTLTLKTSTISFAVTGFGTATLEPVKEFGTSFNIDEDDLTAAGNGIEGTGSYPVIVSGTVTTSFGGVIVTP